MQRMYVHLKLTANHLDHVWQFMDMSLSSVVQLRTKK